MRLAYVTETYPPELNGVALTVERTVGYLRARGHQVDLIRPRQPGEAPRRDDAEWRTHGCAIPMYADLRFGMAWPSSLVARFRERRMQLVHVATPGPLGWAAIGAAAGAGLVATSDFRTNFHHYSHYYGFGWGAPLVQAYLRRLHNRTQRTFAPTHAMRDELAAGGFERVQVVGRGVDTVRFSPSRRSAELRAQWSPEGAPVLLYTGRLAAEKNVELALRAYHVARHRLPGLRMVVVGDGPLRKRLEADHPDVRFTGMQTGIALAEHYASADAFVFPSLSETFGNVTLEALASALPVVAYDTAAAAEHVVDERSGRLVAPGDEAAFIDAVGEVVSRPAAWQQSARELARSTALKAGWEQVLAGFERQLMSTLIEDASLAAGVAYVA